VAYLAVAMGPTDADLAILFDLFLELEEKIKKECLPTLRFIQ